MRSRVSLAAASSFVVAVASFANKTSALATRPAKYKWEKTQLLGEFSFDDALDPAQKKRLANGLPVTVVMRGYVLPNGGSNPVALTAHTCTVATDLWNQVYKVVVNNGKPSPVANLIGVMKRCTRMTDLPIVDRTILGKPQDYYLAVHVEVNPKSTQFVKQVEAWVTRPQGVSGSITLGDALFTTFVGVFATSKIPTADVIIDFQTASFPAAP